MVRDKSIIIKTAKLSTFSVNSQRKFWFSFFFVALESNRCKKKKTKTKVRMGTTKVYVTYNYCWTVTKNKLILNEGGGFLVSQKCSVFLKNKNPPGGLVEKKQKHFHLRWQLYFEN